MEQSLFSKLKKFQQDMPNLGIQLTCSSKLRRDCDYVQYMPHQNGWVHFEIYHYKSEKVVDDYTPGRIYCELHVEFAKKELCARYWEDCLKVLVEDEPFAIKTSWGTIQGNPNHYAIRLKKYAEGFVTEGDLSEVDILTEALKDTVSVIEPIISTYELKIESERKANDMKDQIKELLLSNNNIILTGAPGTGKTYTALAIAKELAGGDQNRIRLVQFHPGYDYSDFVMGLKPVLLDENGNEVNDAGCKLDENGNEVNDAGCKLDENGNEVNDAGCKTKVSVSYRWKPGVFKEFADVASKAENKDDKIKFVLVIDEINRADLSRVFGELFSLIEMDYRGEAKVTLPNGEEFSVPKNLYIIGTMNDIDRSVDSMDFALRRRFAWYEVTAKSSERIIDAKLTQHSEAAGRLKDAMKTLNDYIGGKPKLKVGEREISLGLGTEYQLGGAIFANAEKYEGAGWETKLWENHIKVILSEYLRGNRDKMAILEALEAEYKDKIGLQA